MTTNTVKQKKIRIIHYKVGNEDNKIPPTQIFGETLHLINWLKRYQFLSQQSDQELIDKHILNQI